MLVVLDDDPTGTQLVHDVPVVLQPTRDVVAAAAAEGGGVVHVLTNARAHPAGEAYDLVHSAAVAVLGVDPDARLVARGDSTLRGHVWEEYRAIRDAATPGEWPPLLLVPALPSAGRVTVGGIHLLERDGFRAPLTETEYATDGAFAYGSSRLLEWLEERSNGAFAAGAGVEVPLEQLRRDGAAAVAEALTQAARHDGPAGCVPDAETHGDLELIANGLRATDFDVAVRCAPAFAAIFAGRLATALLELPRPDRGLLVVCGSYVSASVRQLAALRAAYPGAFVDLDVEHLEDEEERLASVAAGLLSTGRLAVLATPPVHEGRLDSLELGSRVALTLARVVKRVKGRGAADLFLFKGGVTSAVCARDGLGFDRALVRGPVDAGVALWEGAGGRCLVVPGNVGDEGVLLRLVREALA